MIMISCNLFSMQILSCFCVLNYRWDSVALLSLWNNNKVTVIYCCKMGVMVYVLQMCQRYILPKLCFNR